jgi:hypothetical protein
VSGRISLAAATVVGQLLLSGGPRHVSPPQAERWPIVVSAHGHVLERLSTGPHGRFRLALSPGTYRVAAREPFAPGRECDSQMLTLARGAAVHIQLNCSIK